MMWLLLGAAALVVQLLVVGVARAASREMPKPPRRDRDA